MQTKNLLLRYCSARDYCKFRLVVDLGCMGVRGGGVLFGIIKEI